MSERWVVDDCGTLIDMETRDTFDYVSEVVGLLNKLNEENEQLKKENEKRIEKELIIINGVEQLMEKFTELREEKEELEKEIQILNEYIVIDDMLGDD